MREPLNRVRIIRTKIVLLNEIIADFNGDISQALLDEKVFKPAILMHLVAIAEQINKLKDENAFAVLEKFSMADLKGLSDMRNFIAHDYEGVDMVLVEAALHQGLPRLQKTVEDILCD
ncbi:MAG TPA: hypothetical protein DCG57_06185 [Candidatus Riflebacteria bacterium]|jgi:uncharacterized protein with HEPN domain|nr:hypothetical protein [Candidatus Riflebacteria bacterium]